MPPEVASSSQAVKELKDLFGRGIVPTQGCSTSWVVAACPGGDMPDGGCKPEGFL